MAKPMLGLTYKKSARVYRLQETPWDFEVM